MIVLINGASSSGKTSLARALQAIWNPADRRPLLYWSLDRVISQLPFSYTAGGKDADNGFVVEGDTILPKHHGYALNEQSAKYVGGLATDGYDVVVDYIVFDPDFLKPLEQHWQTIATCFVGLFCEATELDRRNRQRPDRLNGMSVEQQQNIHFCRNRYDLELDSTTSPPTQLATALLKYIHNQTIKPGFDR